MNLFLMQIITMHYLDLHTFFSEIFDWFCTLPKNDNNINNDFKNA